MKICAIFLCLVAGIASCSSKTTPPDPYATVSGFCEGWGKAACSTTVVSNCSGADPKDVTDALTSACAKKQQHFCEGLVPDGYVSTQAEACLAGVQKAYSDGTLSASEIDTVRHLGAPCDHLIKGPKAKGEACTVDNDCDTVENYVCVLKAGVGACAIPTVVDNGTSCKAPEATCNPGFIATRIASQAPPRMKTAHTTTSAALALSAPSLRARTPERAQRRSLRPSARRTKTASLPRCAISPPVAPWARA